ncbi:MAG TPA: hypothetical protein VKQ32_26390 [Polyangia bacterium]|nr:hypothetical protein [Polyangia bacterium]
MLKRTLRNLAPLCGLWIAVGVYYVFVVSAGHMTRWPAWTGYYETQAQALVSGHIHLLEPPSRALMQLADPWDIGNMPFWRWDHTYFQGHLYIYWGLVPAMIGAAIKVLFHGVTVGDGALTFGFFMARLIAGTLLIRQVARHTVPRPPRWAVALSMLVFALAHPTPYTLARGGVYEAAIMGAVAFLLIGLCFGYRSLHTRSGPAATACAAAAGIAFGLAGGSRLTQMPTAIALALLTALWYWRRPRGPAEGTPGWIGPSIAVVAPAVAAGFALLVINKVRFGAWTEFGLRYTMTYPKPFLGLRFAVPDLYTHAFAPPRLGCAFPYLTAPWDATRVSAPAWLPITWPADHYTSEPTLGLLVVAPFMWLALAAPIVALARWRLTRATATTPATPPSPSASAWGWMTPGRWLWVALAGCLAGVSPLLLLNVTTMRYQNDYSTTLLLVAIFGGWRLLAAPASARGRRATAWLFGTLAVATIVAGVLLGFTGYFKHFDRHNPLLMHALQAHLGLC